MYHFPPFLSFKKLGEVVGPLRFQDPLVSQEVTSSWTLGVTTLDRSEGSLPHASPLLDRAANSTQQSP